MIRFRDATTLALTKLRTRKVRLIVTVVISGLLFSGLAGASMIARGAVDSINDFGKEGLGDRYITEAAAQSSYQFFENVEIIDRATAIHKETVARKKVEAKRLGIAYDAATDPGPVTEYSGPGGDKQRSLDTYHLASKQAISEYLIAHPLPGDPEIRQAAGKYNAKNFYKKVPIPFDLEGAQLKVLQDGKEAFEDDNKSRNVFSSGTDSFTSSWVLTSDDLLKPFILPGQNLELGSDGSIPIIAPYGAVEQLLKLKSLPKSAPSSAKLDRVKEIRTKAKEVTFSVCYRNKTSAELVGQAITIQKDFEQNKDKRDYRKPDVMYGLPAEPCGNVTVTRDVRSKDQKTLDAKQTEFDRIFGEEDIAQQVLTFRVVGIVPDANFGVATGLGEIIRSLVSSSLGNGWYTPLSYRDTNPLLAKLFDGNSGSVIMGAPTAYYTEFAVAADARAFMDKENCAPDFSKFENLEDPFAACAKEGKYFMINAYGSNSLALESTKRTFGKFFGIAAIVVAVIACIIMMGTVGRMIADSRRETAVFRAIGAKKLDIAQIYVMYTIMLSLLISAFALIVGTIFALVIHSRYAEDFTIESIIAYNAQDLNKEFSLYAFNISDVLLIIGLAVAAGLVSAVLPLFRNLRRNPIRDMRDDT